MQLLWSEKADPMCCPTLDFSDNSKNINKIHLESIRLYLETMISLRHVRYLIN